MAIEVKFRIEDKFFSLLNCSYWVERWSLEVGRYSIRQVQELTPVVKELEMQLSLYVDETIFGRNVGRLHEAVQTLLNKLESKRKSFWN